MIWMKGYSTEQKVTPFDAQDSDRFGSSVAIDGDTAVVGASGDNDLGTVQGLLMSWKDSPQAHGLSTRNSRRCSDW